MGMEGSKGQSGKQALKVKEQIGRKQSPGIHSEGFGGGENKTT